MPISPPSDTPARRRPALGSRQVIAALAAVLVIAAGLALVYAVGAEKQPRLAGTNAVFPSEPVISIARGESACQAARVSDNARAIEVPVQGYPPLGSLRMTLYSIETGKVIASGGGDTRRARQLRFDLDRTVRGNPNSSVCIVNEGREVVTLIGSQAESGLFKNGRALPRGGMTLTFMRAGTESSFAMIPVVAERIGRLREFLGGPLRTVALVAFVLGGAALSAALLAGRLRRRVGLAVAAVAVLNAFAWSMITPTFQIPDETSHTTYVQDLAVKGQAPRPKDAPSSSDEMTLAMAASNAGAINFNTTGRPPWDAAIEREWEQRLHANPSTRNPGSYPNVVDYPPLYYATLVPAYAAGHALGHSTIGALTLMRMMSSLYAGITVFALFALVLELFPGRRWLAVGVALACAYQPVLVWISGGVNPDGALIALGSLMFWLFARGFRRGLTVRLALALTLIMVAAALVQIRGLGLAPGWAVGMALLLWRARAAGRGAIARTVGAIVVAGTVPLAIFLALNSLVWERPLIPGGVAAAADGTIAGPAREGTSGILSFLWQYFFPPLGSMTDFFGVPWTVKDLWVPMWVGKFGWYDYQFPNLINRAALVFYAVVAVLALIALVRAFRRRVPTVGVLTLVYVVLAAGVVYALARVAYPIRASGQMLFEQARYLMPLVAFYALALALAATVLRRWGRAAITMFVGVCFLHLLIAFELTIQRYYL
jgi:hypothetical protein